MEGYGIALLCSLLTRGAISLRLSDLPSGGQLPVVFGLLGRLDEASVLDRKTLGTVDTTGGFCIRRGSQWRGATL